MLKQLLQEKENSMEFTDLIIQSGKPRLYSIDKNNTLVHIKLFQKNHVRKLT